MSDRMIQRESWRDQVAENSARLAFAWGTSTTTGPGAEVHDKSITFQLTFVEKPMFAYGFVVVSSADDFAAGIFPQSAGFVTGWEQDARGLYIGAHVGVNVLAQALDVLEHHFSFIGTGMKDIAIDV